MIESLRNDFQFLLSWDYDIDYTCKESGCEWEGICRCGRITNTQLTKVDVSAIAESLYSQIFDNTLSTKRLMVINSVLGISAEIQKYTIDRVLRINQIWKAEFWNINVSSGYYGQEVEQCVLVEEMVQKLNHQLEQAFGIDNLEQRCEWLLTLENGFVLEEIKGKKYHLSVVDIDDIIFPNSEHQKRVLIEGLEHYSDRNYRGIQAIVKKEGRKLKLIDGYHRLSKTENKLVKVLVVS